MYKPKLKRLSIFILALVLTLTSALSITNDNIAFAAKQNTTKTETLKVHYIDVGQGDSILIQLPNGQTSLIDGGPRSSSKTVIDYLKKQGIKKIDYLIATHPHEDHIGGLPEVIKTFNIGNIYMPNVTHTTEAFENLLLAIKDKDKKITVTKTDDSIIDEEFLKLNVLGPEKGVKYKNLNEHSIVLKLTFKNNSFLFNGDIESSSEKIILDNNNDLKVDVLKVAHHGSKTSTSKEFLAKSKPKYAIICCGKDNSYGHPDEATIDRLTANKVQIYRTDTDGTIIISSDGEKIAVEKKANPEKQNAPPKKDTQSNISNNNTFKAKVKSEPSSTTSNKKETNVYITNTGSKYHRSRCRYLKKSKIPMKLSEARNQGYKPCKVCNP